MKLIIIAGFASHPKALEGVAARFKNQVTAEYEVECYSFSYAMKHRREMNQVCKNAHLVVHSAGCLILGYIDLKKLRSVTLIAPLLPKKRRAYVVGGYKLFASHVGRTVSNEAKQLEGYKAKELASHPVANYRWLLNLKMSRFDLVQHTRQLGDARIPTTVITYKDDVHFAAHTYPKSELEQLNVDQYELPGDHDSFYFWAEEATIIAENL